MDIYVVLEGQSVLGAATSEEGAEEIAERGSPGQWMIWRDGPSPLDRRRDRDDLLLTQRIVRTPLAGNVVSIPEPVIDEATALRTLRPVVVHQAVRYGAEVEEIGRTFGAP